MNDLEMCDLPEDRTTAVVRRSLDAEVSHRDEYAEKREEVLQSVEQTIEDFRVQVGILCSVELNACLVSLINGCVDFLDRPATWRNLGPWIRSGNFETCSNPWPISMPFWKEWCWMSVLAYARYGEFSTSESLYAAYFGV